LTYRGSSIPESHTSLCLQLIFQSDKKTLENKQIDHIISGLQLLLTEEFAHLSENRLINYKNIINIDYPPPTIVTISILSLVLMKVLDQTFITN
jgi:hypothetical protein